MSNVKRDDNRVPGLSAETDDSNRTPEPLKVDPTTKGLKITKAGYANVGDGNVTVTTPGTAVQLIVTSTPCKRVIVHAVNGHIVVGASDVDYTAGSRKGRWIPATQEGVFYVDDVNKLYVDAADASTLISFYYEC